MARCFCSTPTVNGRLGDNRICERRERRLSLRYAERAGAESDASSPSAHDGATKQDPHSNALRPVGSDRAPLVVRAESQAGTIPDLLPGYLPLPTVPDADDSACPLETSPNDPTDFTSLYASDIDWPLRVDLDVWAASAHSPPSLRGMGASQGTRQGAASDASILSVLDPSLGGLGGAADPSCACADLPLTDEEFDRLIMTLHRSDGGEELGDVDSTTLGCLSLVRMDLV